MGATVLASQSHINPFQSHIYPFQSHIITSHPLSNWRHNMDLRMWLAIGSQQR